MVITKREDVTRQGFCKILWRKLRLRGSLLLIVLQFLGGGRRKGIGAYLSLSGSGREAGWGGGCLFNAVRLDNFSAFRMGAYSRWALIRGWALFRINRVSSSSESQNFTDVCMVWGGGGGGTNLPPTKQTSVNFRNLLAKDLSFSKNREKVYYLTASTHLLSHPVLSTEHSQRFF